MHSSGLPAKALMELDLAGLLAHGSKFSACLPDPRDSVSRVSGWPVNAIYSCGAASGFTEFPFHGALRRHTRLNSEKERCNSPANVHWTPRIVKNFVVGYPTKNLIVGYPTKDLIVGYPTGKWLIRV